MSHENLYLAEPSGLGRSSALPWTPSPWLRLEWALLGSNVEGGSRVLWNKCLSGAFPWRAGSWIPNQNLNLDPGSGSAES